MSNYIKSNILIFSILSILFIGISSCRDDKLGKAEDTYATIFPSSPNLNLVYGVDTINMQCKVMNHSGTVFNTDVKWTSSDESVVKFLDGTNKLVAVEGSQGKSAIIRATLPNGKYSETTANVIKLQANGITLYKVDGDQIVPMKSIEYINRATPTFVMVTVSPVEVGLQGDYTLSGEGFTVTPYELNPETDKSKINSTPKGAKWYLITANDNGEKTLNVSVGGENDPKYRFEISQNFMVGPVVSKMGLNRDMNEAEGAGVLDVNQHQSVVFYLEVNPADDASVRQVFNNAVWNIKGVGALVRDKRYELDEGKVKFIVDLESGSQDGEIEVGFTLQNSSVRKTIKIVNFANQPFNNIMFSPAQLDEDLYVGETKSVRILVDPMSSYPYLSQDFQLHFTTPDVAEYQENNGVYTIKALKQGETDLVVSVRGREARFHIVTKAAVRSVLIDNTTPNVIMEGDNVQWKANVTMQGDDLPDFNRLMWSIIEPIKNPIVTIPNSAHGEYLVITAGTLSDGQASAKATIKAEYRGKEHSREITVVPIQKSQDIVDADLNGDDYAYIEKKSDRIKIELGVTQNAKSSGKATVTYWIKPNGGVNSDWSGTYDTSNSNISISWNDVLNVTKAVTAGSITITKVDGSHYAVSANTSVTVANSPINVNANISRLTK